MNPTSERTSAEKAKRAARSRKKKFINLIVGLVIAGACLLWLFQSVEKEDVFTRVRNVHRFNLLLATLFTISSYLLRSWRWPFFFETGAPKFWDSFRCLIVGFFMNNVLPARLGEFVRAHLGGRVTKHSRTTVLATIAGERLIDGLTISLIFVVFFSLGADPQQVANSKGVWYVSYLFGIAALGTAILLLFRNQTYRVLAQLGTIMPGHLSQYTLKRVKLFIEGLEPILRPVRLVTLSLQSLLIWLVELSVYYEVAAAFDCPLNVAGLSLFLAAVNFSSLVPGPPGGVGVIEFFAVIALEQIGVPRDAALVMVSTQHLIQMAVIGFPGVLFVVIGMGGHLPDQDDEMSDEEEPEAEKFSDVSQAAPMSPAVTLPTDTVGGPHISIVVPAYNEEDRLPKTLLSIVEYFKTRTDKYEVLVVDDGSTDGTARVVQSFSALSPEVKLLSYQPNRGKGYAVRHGMLQAAGELIIYNDADGASPIYEIVRLEDAIRSGAQVAIGSRARYSRDTAVETVWYRKFMGRVFNGAVNFLILPGIADTQCGFKMFVRPAAQYIFSRQRAERFSFDVEILFLARKAGLRIAEVPINWTNIPGSKVNLVKDSLMMFVDVMKFRLRDLAGGYRQEADLLVKK